MDPLVGRVAALIRYPVKSMAAEPLARADVGWHGLAGDRRWAFVRPDRPTSGFPWLTVREVPQMCRYRPELAEPDRPDASAVVVVTPDGRRLPVLDAALAAELGEGVRVIKQDRGVPDVQPLSLLTTQSLASLAAQVGQDLDVRRFRPNLLVEAVGPDPWPEDAWVGRTLRVGAARLRVDQRDRRCVLVEVDPATGARGRGVLPVLARERQACLGVYGSTVAPGGVAVGDPVVLEP